MAPQDLGRKSLLLLGSTWGGTALAMLVSLLIARLLGPAALGGIGWSLGAAGLCMAALLPGFAQAHLKRLAEGQDAGRCLGTMAVIQLVLTGALLAAVATGWALGGAAGAPELGLVFVFVLASQVSGNFADIFLKVFIAREWIVGYSGIVLGARITRLVVTLAVLLWAPSVTAVAATFPLEGILSCAAAALVLARQHGVRTRAPTRESLRGYWTYARPFMVTTPLALVQDSVDRFLVGHWAGLAAAGHYHVARALWEALSSVIAALATFIFTRLSALFATRSAAGDAEARRFFWGALDKLLFVVTPLAFLFWAGAEALVTLLYGAQFHPAVAALRILVLAAVAAAVVNPYTHAVYALDEGARFVPVNLLRVVVYLASLAVLIPEAPLAAWLPWHQAGLWTGEAGAGGGRLLLVLFPAWVYFRWTRDLAGIPLYPRVWIYLAGFALLLAVHHGLEWALSSLGALPVSPLLSWPLPAAAALGAYLLLLLCAHGGTRDNLAYALSLLSPRRFREFIVTGLRRT